MRVRRGAPLPMAMAPGGRGAGTVEGPVGTDATGEAAACAAGEAGVGCATDAEGVGACCCRKVVQSS